MALQTLVMVVRDPPLDVRNREVEVVLWNALCVVVYCDLFLADSGPAVVLLG